MLRLQGVDIVQTDFRRLKDGDWLSDDTLNPFLKKYVQDAVPLTHVFQTHFFTRLREGGEYRYRNVARWGRRINQRLSQRIGEHVVGG